MISKRGKSSSVGVTPHSPDYSFDYGPYHFICVDSGKPDNFIDVNLPGLNGNQLAWMKYTDYPAAESRGSTHTFIFTHAPIVDATHNYLCGLHSEDYTHMSPNDYNFVYWITKSKPTPNVEAVFAGHTHDNKADYLKGILPGGADDGNIDWSTVSDPTGTFYYSSYPVSFQAPKSTG